MKLGKGFLALMISSLMLFAGISGVFAAGQPEDMGPEEGEPTLTFGVLGVMTGHAAAWGLVCKYCAEANAKIYNDAGGVEIDGTKYKIKIVSIDTKQDPKVAVTGAERMVEMGIKYVVGPNVDNTALSVANVFHDAGVMYMPYSFNAKNYSPPHENAILGQVAAYQASPVMYKWMMDEYGIKTVSFVARNSPDPLNQRKFGMETAQALGLEILSYKDTYEPGTSDFNPIMAKIIRDNPDLIVLSGVSPGDAAHLLTSAREQGYKGLMECENTQDAVTLVNVAKEHANGFIYLGGATAPSIETDYMRKFREVYTEVAGQWNGEAGTKAYAIPAYVWGLQEAGKEAINDVEVFKEAIPRVSVPNPFIKGNPEWKFVGEKYFQQKRQVMVPLVITQIQDGKEVAVMVTSVE
jgi:branched-chain amino acid transport system substrate-binding protein